MIDKRLQTDRLLIAEIWGEARRHVRCRELSSNEEAAAVAALRELTGCRADLLAGSGPAAVNTGGTLYMLAVGTDRAVWVTQTTDGTHWAGWRSLGGQGQRRPGNCQPRARDRGRRAGGHGSGSIASSTRRTLLRPRLTRSP